MTIQQKLRDDQQEAQLALRSAEGRLQQAKAEVDREQWRLKYINELLRIDDGIEPAREGAEPEIPIGDVVDQVLTPGMTLGLQEMATEAMKLGYGDGDGDRERVVNNLSAYLRRKSNDPESGIESAGRGKFRRVYVDEQTDRTGANGQEIHA
jgi:hypothetical protein